MKFRRKIFIAAVILVIFLILIFFLWASFYYKASERAVSFCSNNNDKYFVEDKGSYISFKNKENTKDSAFIFYPGEKVDVKAYSPIAEKIVERGYDVFICRMPLNLAIFNINAADRVLNDEKYSTYVIGGHSLGGEVASYYTLKHDKEIKGLILLAAYPYGNSSYKNKDLKVVSLYGSEDKIANVRKIEQSKKYFDRNAVFEIINGGTHGAFGDYEKQKGDGELKITQDKQEDITVDYITAVLRGYKTSEYNIR